MGILITPSFTFTPGSANAGTINFTGVVGFDAKRVSAVYNITRNVMLYAPLYVPGSFSGTTLTISVDTTGHNSADLMYVKYDDPGLLYATGTVTRPASTPTYASGQMILNNATAGSCVPISLVAVRTNDSSGATRRPYLRVNDTAWVNATVRAHFFRNSPTFAAGDTGAFSGNLSESGYLGSSDITFDRTFSDFVSGFGIPGSTSEISFLPAAGTQTIFSVLEARSSVAAAASKVFTLQLEVYTT